MKSMTRAAVENMVSDLPDNDLALLHNAMMAYNHSVEKGLWHERTELEPAAWVWSDAILREYESRGMDQNPIEEK